jgi:O-succinylbenzoate synthase
VVVLKCAPLGGVRRALEVAQACGLPCVVSSALESAVGMAAEIALAGALPDLEFACGLGTGALLAADVAPTPTPVGGFLPVPTRAPDPVLAPQLAAAPDRTAWWGARLARVSALDAR